MNYPDNFDKSIIRTLESMPQEERGSWYKIASAAMSGDETAASLVHNSFPEAARTLATYYQIMSISYHALTTGERNKDYNEALQALNCVAAGGRPIQKPLSELLVRRLNANLTQKQLSDLSGVSVGQISRLERGTILPRNLTLSNAAALAQVLGCHAEELL